MLELGRLAYAPCLEVQRRIVEDVIAGTRGNTLIFVEHDPILTLGASFREENLLLTMDEYCRRGIDVTRTDRGGDVTFHGPGQLVIYPIFRLEEVGKDLHKWLRNLEETVLGALGAFGIEGRRFPPHTGAWVGDLKIAAIGIKIRKWVSMHGIALNCANDVSAFDLIVPCGIRGYGVTSLSDVLGRQVTVEEAKGVVTNSFAGVFRADIR